MPSFFISSDDAVWTMRAQGDLLAALTRLMESPETFLSEDPHAVARGPLVVSLWSAARSIARVEPVYRRLFTDTAALGRVLDYLRQNPQAPVKEFEAFIDGMDLTPAQVRLFEPDQSVMVSVQYGPVVDIVADGDRIRTVEAKDELVLQGEYGTNFVRAYGPLTLSGGAATLPEDTPVQVTLTATNLAFVHFEIGASAAEAVAAAAQIALSPTELVAFLNRQCASPYLTLEPLADFAAAVTPYADRQYGSFGAFCDLLRKKLQFRLPDESAATHSSYEFLYQAPAPSAVALATTEVTNCQKLVTVLSPEQLEELETLGYFYVTLSNGQTVRWAIE